MPADFFVELYDDVEKNKIELLFAFEAGSEDDRLPDYTMFVKLVDWMPDADL